MNILSLFDGKSSGYTAAELAGLKIDNYYSSEVDKYAIQVSNAIHPNQIRLGDITKWREWDVEWDSIDLLIAGSPCQGFSFAGKQLAFDDPRSKLFFEFVDILNHIKSVNPNVKFMLENVKMKKEYIEIINTLLGVESFQINSDSLSAQNRQRLYWSNIPIDYPEDRGVFWKDVFCSHNVNDSMYYSCKALDWIDRHSKRTGKQLKIYYPNDEVKMQMVEASHFKKYSSQRFFGIEDVHGLRYITPRECFRLQTMPENLIDKALSCGVSNTQLYKIAGNGWTDEVIAHIFRGLSKLNGGEE